MKRLLNSFHLNSYALFHPQTFLNSLWCDNDGLHNTVYGLDNEGKISSDIHSIFEPLARFFLFLPV